MTLFVVSTKDGWMDIMRRGIDARGIDLEVIIFCEPLNYFSKTTYENKV